MHTPRSYVQRERDRFDEERKVADEVCVEVEWGVWKQRKPARKNQPVQERSTQHDQSVWSKPESAKQLSAWEGKRTGRSDSDRDARQPGCC